MNELETKRAKLVDDARAIYEPALDNGRSLEEDERSRLQNIDQQIKEIDEKLEKKREDDQLIGRLKGFDDEIQKNKTSKPSVEKKGSIGDQFVNDERYKSWLGNVAPEGRVPDSVKGIQSPSIPVSGLSVKSLITGLSDTGAGAFITPDDTGEYVPLGRYDATVLDLIGRRETGSDVVEFVRQTAQITQAAPTPEATSTSDALAAKPEGAMAFVRVQAMVKTIPVWIPATKQALSDVPQMRGLINDEILGSLRDKLANQVLQGDGEGANFEGIYNTSGILTRSFVTDKITTTRKAITYLRATGKVIPTAWLFHPNDWEAFDLLKNENGDYYRGGPFMGGPNTLWRIPVVESYDATEGDPLLGAWMWANIYDRQQPTISVSDSHSDFFTHNLVAILGELRAAFGVKKPQAFCDVSLTAS